MPTPQLLVLLVDDDPLMLKLMSAWLGEAGYAVKVASDGYTALKMIEAECPDFVITDWQMPGMDGIELCRRIRALELPHYVYLFFVTAKSTPEAIMEGLEVGADDFLGKPVHRGELLARLRAGGRILKLERHLNQLVRSDSLTGLATQRAFYDVLEKQWQRSQRNGLPLSCVMLDLDFFKRINDVYGHQAGDAILRAVAGVLVANCRAADVVCRYGGEEFCAMLPETSERDAAIWAERIRRRVAALVVPIGEKEVRVTVSLGVAQRYEDTQTCGQLVDQADQALLCAKQSGRDRVVCYESLGDTKVLKPRDGNNQNVLFRGVLARHVMTPLVACLRQDDTIGQAAEFFLRLRINSTPVVDATGRLAGMLSEKDLLAAMASLECWQRPVREVMKPNVICYEEDTPIRVIYEFLCRVSIRRVVIVSQGQPTGTISRGTLLRWFGNLVLSKGLLNEGEVLQEGELEARRARQRLVETARELARLASSLERRVEENAEDLVSYIVGEATGMQDLLTDILAHSRFVAPGGGVPAWTQSLVVDSGHID